MYECIEISIDTVTEYSIQQYIDALRVQSKCQLILYAFAYSLHKPKKGKQKPIKLLIIDTEKIFVSARIKIRRVHIYYQPHRTRNSSNPYHKKKRIEKPKICMKFYYILQCFPHNLLSFNLI